MTQQDQLLAALPNLSAEALVRVRDQATILLNIGSKRGVEEQPDEFTAALYDALADELKRRTQVKQPPFRIFSASVTFHDKFGPAARVASEANAAWFPRQSKAELTSMALLYAQVVVDHLQQRGIPAVWTAIASTLHALPQVMDQAFPGYAQAGLLGKVQQLRTKRASV